MTTKEKKVAMEEWAKEMTESLDAREHGFALTEHRRRLLRKQDHVTPLCAIGYADGTVDVPSLRIRLTSDGRIWDHATCRDGEACKAQHDLDEPFNGTGDVCPFDAWDWGERSMDEDFPGEGYMHPMWDYSKDAPELEPEVVYDGVHADEKVLMDAGHVKIVTKA